MSQLNMQSSFISYILTEEDQVQGHIFNSYQLMVLRNELALAAEEKVNLPFVPENLQREAELQGKILFLKWLLQMHDEMLARQAQSNQGNQTPDDPSAL